MEIFLIDKLFIGKTALFYGPDPVDDFSMCLLLAWEYSHWFQYNFRYLKLSCV